jgi:hypothetical protein
MMEFELDALLRGIAPIVRGQIQNATASVLERIAALEARAPVPGPAGERGERGDVGPAGPVAVLETFDISADELSQSLITAMQAELAPLNQRPV